MVFQIQLLGHHNVSDMEAEHSLGLIHNRRQNAAMHKARSAR